MDGLVDIVALKPAQLWALIIIFLPGFISLKLHRFVERRETSAGEDIINVVGFSLLNALILFWPIYWTSVELALPRPNYVRILLPALAASLLGPIAWPIAFQLAQRFVLRGAWLLGEPKSPFEAYFSTKQPCWIIVRLADGSAIGGYFGSSSFASIETGDFYVEELWNLDEGGRFNDKVSRSKGALFRQSDYIWLEFFWDREEDDSEAAA